MDPRTDAEVIASSVDAPAAFGELFDRHATTLFRYFVRRVGPDEADSLLGPVEVGADTKKELTDAAKQWGEIGWDNDASTQNATRRTAEMLQLIAATREFQFG